MSNSASDVLGQPERIEWDFWRHKLNSPLPLLQHVKYLGKKTQAVKILSGVEPKLASPAACHSANQ